MKECLKISYDCDNNDNLNVRYPFDHSEINIPNKLIKLRIKKYVTFYFIMQQGTYNRFYTDCANGKFIFMYLLFSKYDFLENYSIVNAKLYYVRYYIIRVLYIQSKNII